MGLHKLRSTPSIKLNKFAVLWLWAVSFTVAMLVVYGIVPYQKDIQSCPVGDCKLKGAGTAERSLYNGLHRLAWSICLSWVILACSKGFGGPVNRILSWKVWLPLARLSYCIYL